MLVGMGSPCGDGHFDEADLAPKVQVDQVDLDVGQVEAMGETHEW